MRALLLGLAAALGLAKPAAAQEGIFLYSATLGTQDFVDASGARLGDLCAIVQQDRTNFHRFGRRDAYDSDDSYFGSSLMRLRIPGMCRLQRGADYIRKDVLSGKPRFVAVYGEFNDQGVLVGLIIGEGSG